MTLHQLVGKSQRLRRELEALYGEPVWNTRAIDRVSDELTEAQMALARRGVTGHFSDAEEFDESAMKPMVYRTCPALTIQPSSG